MNEKKSINMRALKGGSYSLVICAAALALVIVLNLFISALPSSVTKLDASSIGILDIGDETRTIVSAVDEPVYLYLIAQRGGEDMTIRELLGRYADLNKNIKIETVDPDVKPGFVSQYTNDTLNPNSVIVASDRRSYAVDYTEIYVTSYENITEEDLYNYYYYGIEPKGTPYFYGESALTSAIDYVTAEKIPTVYSLSGHDEDSLSETMTAYFTMDNVLTGSLSLLTDIGIPEDCSALLINNPKTDLSAFEAETLTGYLAAGGNVILVTDFRYCTAEKMPNLTTVTAAMGMTADDGIIVETNRNNYYSNPLYLLPVLSSGGPAGELSSTNVNILLPNAHAISVGDGASALLKTTTASILKKAGANIQTYEKEDGDTDGPCTIAAYSEQNGGKMVWFATPSIVSDQWDYYVNGGNSGLFMASVSWMCEKQANVSIIAKQMQVQSLVVPEAASGTWSLLLTVLLPLAVIAGGFFVWFRRTRR